MDQTSANVLMITLDDGEKLGIESEHIGYGIYAPVLYPASVYGESDATVR